MQQIIDNLKTLRNGLFKDEQAVIELIDETIKLAEQKASQFNAIVMPKIADKVINIELHAESRFLLDNIYGDYNVPKDEMWVFYENGNIQKFKIIL